MRLNKSKNSGLGVIEIVISLCVIVFLTMLLLKSRKRDETKMAETLKASGVELKENQKATSENVQKAVTNKMEDLTNKHQEALDKRMDEGE